MKFGQVYRPRGAVRGSSEVIDKNELYAVNHNISQIQITESMGISVEQWRQRIGTFSQPVRCSSAFPHLIVRSTYISLGIRILLFLMLVTQGVESNPGPGSNGSETSAANQFMP